MQAAARLLVGTYDFAAFATKGSDRETTVRTVLRVDVGRYYEEIRIDVEGTGFLYNQVRNMVGTLIEIGRGRWEPEYISDILASRDRSNAGPTAPARGLCLQWVRYDLTRPYPLSYSKNDAKTESNADKENKSITNNNGPDSPEASPTADKPADSPP